MLDVITYILNHTSKDSILLYSSDVMILEREKNEININNEMGFWNTDEMLSKKKLILLKNKWYAYAKNPKDIIYDGMD